MGEEEGLVLPFAIGIPSLTHGQPHSILQLTAVETSTSSFAKSKRVLEDYFIMDTPMLKIQINMSRAATVNQPSPLHQPPPPQCSPPILDKDKPQLPQRPSLSIPFGAIVRTDSLLPYSSAKSTSFLASQETIDAVLSSACPSSKAPANPNLPLSSPFTTLVPALLQHFHQNCPLEDPLAGDSHLTVNVEPPLLPHPQNPSPPPASPTQPSPEQQQVCYVFKLNFLAGIC